MKNIISAVVSLLVVASSIAYGAVPPLAVTVSDASGKAAFKGTTDAKGTFATATLKPGNYVVQLNSKSAMKGNQYSIVVAAGKKKVAAGAVPGEKFNRGGVALRVEVATGLNITGQVATEAGPLSKNGKKMVWIPPMLGSNMPGHWAEEGSAEEIASRSRGVIPQDKLQDMQSKGQGLRGN